jgi:hypothetical protein
LYRCVHAIPNLRTHHERTCEERASRD